MTASRQRASRPPRRRPVLRSAPSPDRHAGPFGPPLLVIALLAVALAACGSAVPSGSAASTSAPPASPGDSAGRPRATPWPGNAVIGIEKLGVADAGILAAINDFSAGVANEDLALMRRAAEGLIGTSILLENADQIDIYPPLQELAASYRDVIPRIVDAATRLRDAIDAGDGAGISAASRDLATALTDYAGIQPVLAGWVVESLEQKRIFVR